ncbi:hypothetical protein [Amycolatopsis aidingensis]|uniref:hypothetical protein n=1 Tax=Amycolatopsis aidingensis TaxID=2842453 RepID=UPI001C0DA01B|nr:hypothetical protein [Amycolatopsis aidingensis]
MKPARQTHLNQALMRIPRRAESVDRSTLAATYVAAGSFAAMLHSADHQILYGRRGTGKTHALLYLSDLVERAGDVAVYVDLRTIGAASGLYADSTQSLSVRGTQLLVDTLEAIHEQLLTVLFEREVGDQDRLLRALDDLAAAATAVEVVGEVERETTRNDSAETSAGMTLGTATGGSVQIERRAAASAQRRLRRTGIERHHVVFGPLSRALHRVAASLGRARIWLLLDEWSSVPVDLQPLLADLLRRCVLPATGLTVKIAAIERRSTFSVRSGPGSYLGIEVGADAASAVSLDDVLLFDQKRTAAREFFGRLFFNHVAALLTTMISDPPADADRLLAEVFRRDAFAELVRAAEGLPRDAINIAALAAQHAHDAPVGVPDVRLAARDWYLRDKQTALTANHAAGRMLRLLVDEVVGRRRSRTFLLAQSPDLRNEVIDELHDARLLHLLRRGIVDRHQPGALYDGFAIDYGCYVALLLEDRAVRPKDRGTWLSSTAGIPPEGFNPAKEAVDLTKLG